MKKLNPVERETVILFNESEATAEIEAYNAGMKKRLEALRRERPEEITLVRSDEYSNAYTFPKKWIKIIPPHRASEKQRAHLAQARTKLNQ